MRQGLYDGIWVSMVKKKILDNPDTNWIIPDVRFPNEVKMIKEICGDDEQKWKESIDCGKNVMRSRIKFWDQILFEIKKTDTN